ncbi:MAG: hypothetical protein ACI814_002813 [Mariniblastus sp.]|jgi:hypothetical protein
MKKTCYSRQLPLLALTFAISLVPTALNAQESLFDLKKLESFGMKKYKMIWEDSSSGSLVEHERGTMTFTTVKNNDSIVLKNVTRLNLPDGKRFIEYQGDCVFSIKDEKIEFRNLKYQAIRSDKVVLYAVVAEISDGKMIQKTVRGEKEMTEEQRWTPGSYPDLAVFFLIPQLPKKNGQVVKIESVFRVPSSPDAQATARSITCMGIDKDMKFNGQPSTKFVNLANGEKSGINYWFDGEGQLRRIALNPENRLDLIVD